MAFAFGTTTWGAYPGHAATDIQSGTGVVGNALMFDRPQKSVVTGPFRASPRAADVRHVARPGCAHRAGSSTFQLDPGAAKLPGLLAAALR